MKWVILLCLAAMVGSSVPGPERWYFMPVCVLLVIVVARERRNYAREVLRSRGELEAELEKGRILRAELLASEGRFKSVLDNSPVAILQFDRELNIVYGNKALEDLVELDNEKLMRINLAKLKDNRLESTVRMALEGKRASYEGPYHTTYSNKTLHLSMACSPLRGVDGELVGGIGIYVDVTGRHLAEEENDRIRRRCDDLVRCMPVGAYTMRYDRDGGRAFEYVSPRLCEILGVDGADLLRDAGIAFAQTHPDDLASLLDANARCTATMEPFLWEGRILVNGAVRWMRIESRGEPHPEGGSVWSGVIADRTERHEWEVALAESEERYRELFEKTPVPMWMFDKDTLRFEMVNQAAVEKYGYSREEFLAMRLVDIRYPEDEEQLRTALLPNPGGAYRGVARHRTKTGEELRVEISSREAVFEGRTMRFSVLRDVTEQLRAQEEVRHAMMEAEAASRAKSEFLATISHEIRTPMNAVLGMLQLASAEEERPRQRERLDKARGAARALLAILNDVLDYSKIEAGGLVLEEVEFDPREMVHGVADLFQPQIAANGVRFEVEVDPALPRKVLGDPLRLRQILSNLVGNASKFTHRGTIRLEAFVDSEEDGSASLRFTVRDTGIGISGEQLERLFQPFVQGDSSTTRRFGGTGLGLSISRDLVRRMGGEIQVRSEPGNGAIFEFSIRAKLVERADVPLPSPPPVQDRRPVGAPRRIRQLHHEYRDALVCGGSTAGEIVSGKVLKGAVVAMALDSDTVENAVAVAIEDLGPRMDLDAAFASLERHIGSPLEELDPDQHVGLVITDGLSGAEERLIEGIAAKTEIVFVGGSAGDDLQFKKTQVYLGKSVHEHAAILVLMKVPRGFDVVKTQSFKPTGIVLEATEVDEAERTVISFNGKPALHAYAHAIGALSDAVTESFMTYPLARMVGGEPFVRSPQKIMGTSIKFYCGVKKGENLAVMEATDIIADTTAAFAKGLAESGGARGVVDFHCILRAMELESKGFSQDYGAIFKDVPTVGFCTYGEAWTTYVNQTSTMLLFK